MESAPNTARQDSGEGSEVSQATAVVVTFNSEEVITQSLRALQDCPAICRIIVVDNASSDSTASLVSENFPNVDLILNSENIGFGPGNNLGLEQVTTEFALTLNPDAIVSSEGVSRLLQVARNHPNTAIVGPVLRRPEENRSTFRVGSVWDPRKTSLPDETDLEVDFLSGAAMLMRMSLVRKSGFFDPDIFLFYEDDDICRSARRAGYSLILTSKAKVTHFVGRSTVPCPEIIAFKQCHFTWSRLYLERKEFGLPAAMKLARKTLKKLFRKQLLARLIRDQAKLQTLKARAYAVKSFMQGEAPSRIPAGFLDHISEVTGSGASILPLGQTNRDQRQLSRPA